MKFDEKVLKQILLDETYVTEEDIKNAEKFAEVNGASFVDSIIQTGAINKDLLGQALAESFKVPYSDLNSNMPVPDQVKKIPEDIARKYSAVIFSESDSAVIIATDNPQDPQLLPELQKIFPNKKISITYSLSEDVDASFINYQKTLETRFSKIIKDKGRVAPEIISEIFADAILYHASDIHFEPEEKDVIVRFRVDGVLQEAGRIPKEYYENILNRIKVQSRMRIDDHFSAQDGAFRYVQPNGNAIDARVSIVPTVDGEKIAIRLLSEYVRNLSFKELGISEDNQRLLTAAADKPFGMILVTGPTGSGKTTTLYALLKTLNRRDVNITTIEDPVEYRISGVNQIQVNPKTNLTFAQGLRSIVRQDPDIILVGEIRDNETAEISINAALTGQLLFSTFHAHDAPTSIPRILDMDVEPFLLSSTLKVIVAQRLVRKICESCRHSVSPTPEQLKSLGGVADSLSRTIYEGRGCNVCNFTGYRGRIGIFEFIDVTKDMQELILKRPSTNEIWQLARTQGSKSLFEDGLLKVNDGTTTLEELMRVAEPPKY